MTSASELEALVRRAHAEYMEMPGLCLSFSQATRLWGIDSAECQAVFQALVAAGFLIQTPEGCFIRATEHLKASVKERGI